LPTLGNGFDDIGGKESKSQDPPDVRFTQVACARDLGGVSIFTPTKRLDPGSAPRHREHKRTVKARGRCTGIAGHNNLVAISATPLQWHTKDLRAVRPKATQSEVTRLKNDLSLRCMNHDPFDMTANQIARALITKVATIAGWNLLVGKGAAYRFNNRPLQLVRAYASDRSRRRVGEEVTPLAPHSPGRARLTHPVLRA
jgi:hypothetical protein